MLPADLAEARRLLNAAKRLRLPPDSHGSGIQAGNRACLLPSRLMITRHVMLTFT